jgi:cytochrome b pre-mRNA-processing protein 3
MKLNPFARSAPARTISALYGAIVAQARQPAFYRNWGVPDTVNGRFDMLVLHLALFLDRMQADTQHRAIGQGVFDRFCAEMDGHFRESGVGDLTVPKRMKEVGESFYGRRQAYHAALALPDNGGLEAALRRNVYGGPEAGPALAVSQLAAYMRTAQGLLETQEGLMQGILQWPDLDTGPADAA